MNKLPIIDLGVIVVYFVATMGVGIYFMRKSRSSQAYMSAGGAVASWLVGMSIFATYVSSITFLALPGSAYQNNWSRFTFSLSIPIAAWIAIRFFVPLYRGRGEISAYSYLEHRFGRLARAYAAIFYLLTQIARMGTVMYLMALPLAALLGLEVSTLIIITGISTTIYAMLGGIEGVIWTDAIQGFVLIGGALLCALLLLFNLPGGPMQLFQIAVADDKFSLGSLDLREWGKATFWVILLNGIFINLNNFGVDQNYIQRYLTARSESEAKKAVWLGSLLYLPVSFIFFFIGTALYAFYHARPELLPASLQAGEKADQVFPYYIVNQLPAGLTGLVIAAIFAAAMSTIATSLNSSATILYTDFYHRYFRPRATERDSMLFLQGTTLFWGLLGTGMALWMIDAKSALDTWWKLSSVFSGGMLGLFLLGYLSRRATNLSAVFGMVLGLLVICWMTISTTVWWKTRFGEAMSSPFHEFLVIVFGTLTIFFVGFFISCLLPGAKRPAS